MNGALTLDDLQILIFDEADRMLSVGFYPDMKAVQRYLPSEHVNTCMFSATYPPHVLRLANEFLQDPEVISLSSDHVHVTNTEHIVYQLADEDKDRVLVRLLESENPDSAIIFCNTKAKVNYVTVVLQRYGYDVDQLSGDLPQAARERVLGRVRAGNLRYLVATDVAARGIDIADLSHVFQFEVPENHELYIHRAGRTGRAGASGTAIMLVDLIETLRLGKIIKEYDLTPLEPPIPDEETVARTVTRRVFVLLRTRLRALAPGREQLEPYVQMVELMMMDADGIRALAMLIDDYYQLRLHDLPSAAQQAAEEAQQLWLTERALTRLSETEMQRIAESLAGDLRSRDIMRLERIMRFEELVEELSMSGDEFYILPMLLAEYHARLPRDSAESAQDSIEKPTRRRRRSKRSK
jgi:ATP-dependent RNA helicase DeaD